MKKKILITGASGMLGGTMSVFFSDIFDVYATGNSYVEFERDIKYKKWDLSNKDYSELIKWSDPELIIHCGALTNGNYCKENPDEAFDINGVSLNKFIEATDKKVKIIYISTDAVFSNELSMAKEDDILEPSSVYGKSKELGEFFLKNTERDFLILRTTIVGSNIHSNKSGFVEWILNSALDKKSIGLFSDVIFTPITIWDLIEEIKFLINNEVDSKIYHLSGNESFSKYTFGIELLKSLELSIDFINKSSIMDFNDRAKRSQDQTLDCSKYQKDTGRKLPNLTETIASLIKNLRYNE